MPGMRACFVSASGQNVFFDEMLEGVRDALASFGVPTETSVDCFPEAEDDLAYVFVPHEYLPLTASAAHPTPTQLQRSVVLCTEQPGTPWFEQTAGVAAEAGATVDIHSLGVQELARRGVSARLMRLGYVPAWDRWGGTDDDERPIDLTFMGGFSERRAQTLARCAPLLVRRRAALHVYETSLPHTASSTHFFSGERKWEHLRSAKVILNVHRAENSYFEWQRVVGAVSNGCVVATEHSLDFEPLVPNEHFVAGSLDSLPYLVDLLLSDPERLAAMRDRAYSAVRTELPLSKSIDVLAEAVEDVGKHPLPSGRSPRPQPLPVRPQAPRPEWARLSELPTEIELVRMGMKHLFLSNMDMRRRLNGLSTEDGEETDRVVEVGPQPAASPRVSVVVTLYNLEGYVGDALRSVAVSDWTDLEVVLVDDASTDRSLEAARAQLERTPWVSAKIVARSRNHGLPAARNLAIEHARGELVFMLDADNVVYPHGLQRLVEALDERPDAAFAYGILEAFDGSGPRGLVSWGHWDAARFSHGNYIDAMALLRRSALEEVGGYSTDRRLHGWEDFDLWCALADLGREGVSVPEIVARYRTGVHSMISLTNIDTSEAWAVLLERHGILTA